MLKPAVTQPLQEWTLRSLRLVDNVFVNELSLLGLRRQAGGLADIRLISEHDEKFCLLTIGSVFHHPWRDLANCNALLLPAPAATAGWRETAIVPTKATKAAKRSNEQKIRRQRDGVNVEGGREFVIMELAVG